MKKKTVSIVAIVIILLLAGGIAYLFLSRTIVWVGFGSDKTVSTAVCNAAMVTKYNDATYMIPRNGATEPSIDANAVKQIKTTIPTLKGYENDATCQTLLFLIAINEGDYQAGLAASNAVKSLHEKGLYPSNNIRGNDALFNYDALLKPISPDAQKDPGNAAAS